MVIKTKQIIQDSFSDAVEGLIKLLFFHTVLITIQFFNSITMKETETMDSVSYFCQHNLAASFFSFVYFPSFFFSYIFLLSFFFLFSFLSLSLLPSLPSSFFPLFSIAYYQDGKEVKIEDIAIESKQERKVVDFKGKSCFT